MKYASLGAIVIFGLGFVTGYIAGEERAVISMKPCPIYPMEKLANQSMVGNTTYCTYYKTYGRAVRKEKA